MKRSWLTQNSCFHFGKIFCWLIVSRKRRSSDGTHRDGDLSRDRAEHGAQTRNNGFKIWKLFCVSRDQCGETQKLDLGPIQMMVCRFKTTNSSLFLKRCLISQKNTGFLFRTIPLISLGVLVLRKYFNEMSIVLLLKYIIWPALPFCKNY